MPSEKSPNKWYQNKYPQITKKFGNAIAEARPQNARAFVKDVSQDFLAATLGSFGNDKAFAIFLPTEKRFYQYNVDTGIFDLISEESLAAKVSDELLKCATECNKEFDTESLEFKFRDSSQIRGIIEKARALLMVDAEFFNVGNSEFIPCANGMLNLADKTLLPFSPDYRRRNKLNVNYEPSAKCEKFSNILMRNSLDDEQLNLLQRWAGLALLGVNHAQKLLILTGTAGGGKGTFINVLMGIIGRGNMASLRTSQLDQRFELSGYIGKTLLYGADVAPDFLYSKGASVIKALTGGDPLAVEFKGSNARPTLNGQFNIIVTCNTKLKVLLNGDVGAWERRLAVIEYKKPPPIEKIANLADLILAEEASGVLNWMLDGVDQLRADNWQLKLTANQKRVVDDLLNESQSAEVFVKECLIADDNEELSVSDCFLAYVKFCKLRNWTPLPRKQSSSLIENAILSTFGLSQSHDIERNLKCQRGWVGLKVNLPDSTDARKGSHLEPIKPDKPDAFTSFP